MPDMAYLALRPGVTFAIIGARAIFLDLENDRYCALPAQVIEVLVQPQGERGEAEAHSPTSIGLRQTGLFETSDVCPHLMPVRRDRPVRGVDSPAQRDRLRMIDIVQVAALLVFARRTIGRCRLAELVTPPRLRASRRFNRGNPVSAEVLAHRYRSARRLLPIAPQCLPDSLALRAWLARHGQSCSLVFGVRMNPFTAHCWLESDGVVLNDAPDRIDAFEPIDVFS